MWLHFYNCGAGGIAGVAIYVILSNKKFTNLNLNNDAFEIG